MTCSRCSANLPPDAQVCGTCHALVHAAQLGALATRADAAEAANDLSTALATVRSMLELIPAGTRQAQQLNARLQALSARIDDPGAAPPPAASRGGASGLGALATSAAAFAWKGKFIIAFVLTKAKFLLLGLTKLPTLLSMFVAVGAYAMLFGWKFALGFVLSIYVHEIGHVFALSRYGISASAPMFIPGLGALVRLNQYPANEREDATIGLAGPLWGLGAAAACTLVWLATDAPLAAALARTGAWLNLFNLTPIWQLDGGRGFRALDRTQRWLAVGSLGLAWVVSEDAMVLLIALAGAFRAATDAPSLTGDRRVLWTYAALALALAGLMALVPDPLLRLAK